MTAKCVLVILQNSAALKATVIQCSPAAGSVLVSTAILLNSTALKITQGAAAGATRTLAALSCWCHKQQCAQPSSLFFDEGSSIHMQCNTVVAIHAI
jgi:hypothetical protein